MKVDPTVLGVLIGVSGVVVGAFIAGGLTLFRDWRTTCAKRRRLASALVAEIQAIYRAVEIRGHLDGLKNNLIRIGETGRP
jgi:hypothetical protein